MRVVVTGITGLLGRSLAQELAGDREVELIGTGFSRAHGKTVRLDLLDASRVTSFLRETRPDVIVHAAAERRPDVSDRDPQATRALNVDATATLVTVAREVGAWVLYLSTDYVFDGVSPPHRPDDTPRPLNFYGETKLAGECIVLADLRSIVLRVPLLFGPIESLDESPVTVIAKSLLAHREAATEPLVLDHWATRYPTFTGDVARAVAQVLALRREGADPHGVLHFSGDEPLTKFDMARVICELRGWSSEGLVPSTETPPGAPRPKHVRLDTSALDRLGIDRRTPFREALTVALEGHL